EGHSEGAPGVPTRHVYDTRRGDQSRASRFRKELTRIPWAVLAALGVSSRASATPIAASVLRPSGVTERARLSGIRATRGRARKASASAAPTAPEIWWRRSVQSMQLRQ